MILLHDMIHAVHNASKFGDTNSVYKFCSPCSTGESIPLVMLFNIAPLGLVMVQQGRTEILRVFVENSDYLQ